MFIITGLNFYVCWACYTREIKIMEPNSIEFFVAVIIPAIALFFAAGFIYYVFYLRPERDKKKHSH